MRKTPSAGNPISKGPRLPWWIHPIFEGGASIPTTGLTVTAIVRPKVDRDPEMLHHILNGDCVLKRRCVSLGVKLSPLPVGVGVLHEYSSH